jgi:F-type H+-transporting ATPase subunit b
MVKVGLDITLIIQIIQFLMIVVIVRLMVVGPIHRAYSARDQKVAGLQAEAKECQKAIEDKRLEYEEQLKIAKAEITEYQNKLKVEAGAKAQGILDKVKAEANAEKEAARKILADETIKARASLESQTPELTKQIIGLVTK